MLTIKQIATSAVLFIGSAGYASAELDIPEKTVPAGVPTRVWQAWATDCSKALKFPQLEAKDGTIEAKQTTMNKCNDKNYPVMEYYFTSKPGFHGHTTLYVWRYSHVRGKQNSPTERKIFVK